ncbi:MAG: HAD family hydrolase [Phenylobacterium sp.]|nr:HAD family hydrolase [Phenylobacterium sp.]
MAIRAVFFDVGETLIDETRHWGELADWLSVPRLTFLGVLGAVIARGQHHRTVFEHFAPEFAAAERGGLRPAYSIRPGDFYPDALSTLKALRGHGLAVGVAGNQPAEAEAALIACSVPADHVATSAAWGVEKPSLAFFAKVAELASLAPDEIAYVGDRLDNDVLPALDAGMRAYLIRRGPWGVLHAEQPEAARAHGVLTSLSELPSLLG